MNIRVHRFLGSNDAFGLESVDDVPQHMAVVAALTKGVLENEDVNLGGEIGRFVVQDHEVRFISLIFSPTRAFSINCEFTHFPTQTPTLRDAMWVVNMKRVRERTRELLKEEVDNAILRRFYLYERGENKRYMKWTEVFWQVATVPLCDDLKSKVLRCLITI